MKSIYDVLLKEVKGLREAEKEEETSGIDAFLSGNKVKIASLDNLFKFIRISDTTLVHKAEKDLWKINEDEKGQVAIERLFDPDSKEPLKI